MTTDLQPGAALDAAVHAALGRTKPANEYGVWDVVPLYSTDANAALEAYEEMRKQGWRITTVKDHYVLVPPDWWVVAMVLANRIAPRVEGDGPTFASALCAAIVEVGKR